MRIQVFVAGTIAAAVLAVVAGAIAGLGFWGILGLGVSVLVAAQLLYLVLVAILAAGVRRKARSDTAQNGSLENDDAAPLPRGKLSDN
jgi:hypothetical protein